MTKLNRNNAPDGFVAVALCKFSCMDCDMFVQREYRCTNVNKGASCIPGRRSDGFAVVFKRNQP